MKVFKPKKPVVGMTATIDLKEFVEWIKANPDEKKYMVEGVPICFHTYVAKEALVEEGLL